MAAQGTITVQTTLTVSDMRRQVWQHLRRQRRPRPSRQPVHLYIGGSLTTTTGTQTHHHHHLPHHIDECFNVGEFTLRHNEEHLVVTDLMPNIHQVVLNDDDDAPLQIDTLQSPCHLGYRLRVTARNTVVTVGSDTPLSLLLDLSCLQVDTLMLSISQMIQLLSPQDTDAVIV